MPNGKTVTNFYKQDVYDPSDNKIGKVDDLLVADSGKIDAAVIGVGGFLGMGEKDVLVEFNALKLTQKNNKWYLTMNTTKDELKNAPGWKYDRNTTTWISDKSASNAAPMSNRTARQ
jgi:sporulation protein YlmC with PRC-barrel domain